MSVTDPVCGCTRTMTLPDGTTSVITHTFPKALEHHYPLPPLEATGIPVYRGDFDLNAFRWRGVISIDLEPRPTLVAHGVREMNFGKEKGGTVGVREPAKWVDQEQLTITAKSVPPPAKTTRAPQRPKAPAVVGTLADNLARIDVGDPDHLDYITFFVINGWFGRDGFNTCHDGQERQGRIDIVLDGWQLRVEPRGDIAPDQLRKDMQATGKNTVTHVGRIRRDDGTTFRAVEALDLLKIVETMGGFALGRVISTALPVGYRAGKATWTRWQCDRAVDRPIGATPFLDPAVSAAQMAELFRAGLATSKDTLRWEVFENALGYHYAAEHDATVNIKVLLPVSALQLISYAHLVEELPSGHPDHKTASQWNDNYNFSTTEQLRTVLRVAGIDMSAPPHLVNLAKVQSDITEPKKLPTPDALDCVVRLRNKVAHPKQKQANRWSTEEWAETGFAATTMFNLAMLWWLNYDERYLGKTFEYRGSGDSQFVPWH
ncbi:hypothetical protein EFK50_05445 [Nocardioides marmoriginsengisoli]|uniref:YopA central domain-containing protein n=2 Tax=Nocardioides marmoriginsengisoli TaxID=661483 RepID=A0A3N0CPV5_9ACTN|nr:hypothetical protein EFK50_05445 [Nocardioides marmoriginsengisoli]